MYLSQARFTGAAVGLLADIVKKGTSGQDFGSRVEKKAAAERID